MLHFVYVVLPRVVDQYVWLARLSHPPMIESKPDPPTIGPFYVLVMSLSAFSL